MDIGFSQCLYRSEISAHIRKREEYKMETEIQIAVAGTGAGEIIGTTRRKP